MSCQDDMGSLDKFGVGQVDAFRDFGSKNSAKFTSSVASKFKRDTEAI